MSTGLRPYQEAAVAYALARIAPEKGIFYGLEMGLGKTLCAIETVTRLDAFPCLWLTRSGLKINTAREVVKWAPGRSAAILGGLTPCMSAETLRAQDVTIANHEIVPERPKGGGWLPVLAEVGYKSLVVDECHDLKDKSSKRSQAAKQLATGKAPRRRKATHPPIPYRIGLSGTPVMNGRASELIAVLDILGQLDDMGGFKTFVERYCFARRTRFGLDLTAAHVDRAVVEARLAELNDRMRRRFYYRVEKKDVLTELPDKTYVPLYMPLSNQAAYDAAEEEYLAQMRTLETQPWRAFTDPDLRSAHATRTTRLRKIVGSGKCDACAAWIEEFLDTGRKLVVFNWHRETGAWLQRRFADASAGLIDSGTPLAERDRIVQRLRTDPARRVVFGNVQAMGVGIDGLQDAASDALMVELPWRPGDVEQAADRLHRIGQANPVFVYLALADGTFDDEMTGTLVSKRARMDLTTTGVDQESSFVRVLSYLWEKAHR